MARAPFYHLETAFLPVAVAAPITVVADQVVVLTWTSVQLTLKWS